MSYRYLFLGPPGAGKGTQADLIALEIGVPHISTGAMLREQVARDTELGRTVKAMMASGNLVPDDLVVAMLADRLEREDAVPGFILDGFPRTRPQAVALDALLGEDGLDQVVSLVVPEEEIVRRITGRRSCAEGHVYHVTDRPPKVEGICDVDGLPLFQRSDDTEEVVRNRLAVYRLKTAPLIEYYADILVEVDGVGTVDDIRNRIIEVL
ncbi:adenylate kinase [bacterium BMS3Abin02]|nr:adenylate kinase [bacterium BMS3Abin02]HDK45805.1 adenylate kinase [Actinomycetota bacterium]HDL49338.1 adenylate kinase [Actinomycetota bacterium]